MMWDGHDGMGWWMLWGSILWVVFITAFVVLAVRLAGANSPEGSHSRHTMAPATETPLDIVRRRYASGELSRDQFEQMRRDLGDRGPT